MNVVDEIVMEAREAKLLKNLPLTVTNKDYNLIVESTVIIAALEGEGFKVRTFADPETKTYGLKIS